MHVLGVTPCSSLSAAEVRLLATSIKPEAVYVDMPPEYVKDLQSEMSKTPDGRPQLPGPEWPGFSFRWDRGWAASMTEHTQRLPRELAVLAGLDYYAPVREALRYVGANPSTRLITYPFSVTHKYDDAYEPLRSVVSLEVDLAAPAGEYFGTMSNTLRIVLYPSMSKTLASINITLPPGEYFNTDQLRALRAEAQATVDAAAAGVRPEEWDGTTQLIDALREMHGPDFNPANPPDMASTVLVNSLEYHVKQARSVAFAVQSDPGQHVMAVVDAARVASYGAEWEAATAPEALFPDRKFTTLAVKWGLITTVMGGSGALYWRAARSWPKTAVAATALAGVWGAGVYWETMNQVPMVCGSKVRHALARPVQPIGAHIKLDGSAGGR